MAARINIDETATSLESVTKQLERQDVVVASIATRFAGLTNLGKIAAEVAKDQVKDTEKLSNIQNSIEAKTKEIAFWENERLHNAGAVAGMGTAIRAEQVRLLKLLEEEYAERDRINAAMERQKGNLLVMNKSGMQGMVDKAKELGSIMKAHPLLLTAAASLYVFKKIWASFLDLDKTAADFRKTIGATRPATADLEATARNIAIHYARIGVSAKNVYDSFLAIATTIGTTQATTKDMATDMSIMAAQVGVAEATSAEFLKTMGMMGKTTMDAQRDMLFFAQHMSEAGGVQLNKVMDDVASATKNSYQFMSRSPIALTKAAIEAKKMGTSLSSAASSASKLVDFTNSVKAEMEASVLLGESINLQRARELAYRKDLRGLNAEILKIAQQTHFEDLDPFQQQAVAAALGKTADEVGTILQAERQRQAIFRDPALKKQREEYEKMQKANADIAKTTASSAKEQLSVLSNQEAIKAISLAWNAIFQRLGEVVLPKIATVLTSIAEILNGTASATKYIVAGFTSLAVIVGLLVSKKYIGRLMDWFGAKTGGVGAGAKNLLTGISDGLRAFGKTPWAGILKGAAAVALLGLALIPFAKTMQMMQGIDWKIVIASGIAIIALAAAVAILGAVMTGPQILPILIGVGVIALLGAALIPFAAAAWIASKAMQNLSTVKWMDIAKGIMAVGIQTPLILGMGLAMAIAAPGIIAFSLALIPLSMIAKKAGDAMLNMGTGFKLVVDSIERLQNVSLLGTILQVKSLAQAVTELSKALNAMPDIQVDKIERLQMKGSTAGETPTATVKDTALLDEVKGLRSEMKRLREDFASGKLKASVSMDSQKLDAAGGRSLEFRGALV